MLPELGECTHNHCDNQLSGDKLTESQLPGDDEISAKAEKDCTRNCLQTEGNL